VTQLMNGPLAPPLQRMIFAAVTRQIPWALNAMKINVWWLQMPSYFCQTKSKKLKQIWLLLNLQYVTT